MNEAEGSADLFGALERGDISAEQARGALAALKGKLDEATTRRLVHAFSAWTWKAIDQKRRDPELADWHDVLERLQVRAAGSTSFAAQLKALANLVHQSVMISGTRTADDVLRRKNAREVLVYLSETNNPDGATSKALLMRRSGLKSPNLTRLMNAMVEAGLVERTQHGREVSYRLSVEGKTRANGLRGPSAKFKAIGDFFATDHVNKTWFALEAKVAERPRSTANLGQMRLAHADVGTFVMADLGKAMTDRLAEQLEHMVIDVAGMHGSAKQSYFVMHSRPKTKELLWSAARREMIND